MKEKNKIDPEKDIQSLTKREWIKQKVSSELEIDALYVILGNMNLYYGPMGNSPGNLIEFFKMDQSGKMKIFEALCKYFLASLDLKNDIEIKQLKDHYEIHSKQISIVLKRYLSIKKTFFNRNYYQLPQDDLLFVEPENKFLNSKQCSYLVGAGLGVNRSENKLQFWNDYKADLVINFLKKIQGFGDEHFSVQYNFDGYTEVILSPESLLWEIIDDFLIK